jgi:hypothetical protein
MVHNSQYRVVPITGWQFSDEVHSHSLKWGEQVFGGDWVNWCFGSHCFWFGALTHSTFLNVGSDVFVYSRPPEFFLNGYRCSFLFRVSCCGRVMKKGDNPHLRSLFSATTMWFW